MPVAFRFLFIFTLALLAIPAHADVTLRPNDKPKETAKDFAKDQKKNGFPAPEPVDTTAHFVAGKSVLIELRVATAYLGSVKFLIREQPKYGRLSEFRPSPTGESNRVLVIYTHGGDENELADQFTFAARIGDGAASAPGTVILSGRRAMPRLDILGQPRFKQMQPGEMDSTNFVVMNAGNAPFSGDIVWPAPYTGPKHLDLAVNEKMTVLLAAKPMSPGAYQLALELQPGVQQSKVVAVVECAQSFLVTPGALALTYDPISGVRKGSIKVANGSDAGLTLKVDSGVRVQVVKELYLEPHATTEVEITLPKGDVTAFRGEVLVSQEPSRQKVLVSAEAKPPLIRLVSPADGKLDFGSITKGKKAELKVVLANDGGVPAVFQASQVPPFFVATEVSKLKGDPGKTEEIVFSFAPELPGTFTQTLVIGGNAGRVELSARGVMTDPTRPSVGTLPGAAPTALPSRPKVVDSSDPKTSMANPETPKPPPVPVARVPQPEPSPAPPVAVSSPAKASEGSAASTSASATDGKADAEPWLRFSKMSPGAAAAYGQLMTIGVSATQLPNFQSSAIDPVPQIGVTERGTDHVVLIWREPKVPAPKYMIETSYMVKNPASGLWLKAWNEVKGWEPAKSPATGVLGARISGLQPEATHEFRVIGIDNEGKFSKPSDIIQVATAEAFRLPDWVWILLGIVVLLAVLYKRYQVRQGEWQV